MMKLQIKVMPKSEKSIWAELEEGFKYVSGDKDLSSMILILGMSSLFVMPFNTLMPMFAKDIFNGDARTFSWFESAAGLGSIGSAIYLANRKNSNGLIKMVAIAGVILGGSLLFLAYAPQLPFALFFMTLAGVGMMAQTSAINTYIQTHSIPEMRGRAISYYVMAYQGIIPIGSLLIGWAANLIGPRPAIFIEGTIGLTATVAFIIYRSKYSQRKTVSL
jgi:predicted MFS family arabinose efflux permease